MSLSRIPLRPASSDPDYGVGATATHPEGHWVTYG
jgi:hypothetical protein